MNKLLSHRETELVTALGLSSAISVLFLLTRMSATGSSRYIFLIWNLCLAWLPLIIAWWVAGRLQHQRWATWQNGALTLLWLAFLPNSFYIISDFTHLYTTNRSLLLFDTAMLSSFAFNGVLLGFMSLYLVHRQLLKRYQERVAHTLVAGVLLACSFAIYLGRYLRWNTWDVFLEPAGILFDVSDRLINPTAHANTLTTTVTFFLLLSGMYFVVWRLIRLVSTKPAS